MSYVMNRQNEVLYSEIIVQNNILMLTDKRKECYKLNRLNEAYVKQ